MSIEIIKIIFQKIKTVRQSLLPDPSKLKKKIKNIKNTQIHGLITKGQSSFFSKNTSKLLFLAQEAQTKKNFIFCILNPKILP
jgi:hypothetical protein